MTPIAEMASSLSEARTIGSPSNLELLLHCYYSPEPHERHDAPAIVEGTEYLRKQGMIKFVSGTPKGMIYCATDKGIAFIEYLMRVPFPEAVWTIKETQHD